MPFYSLFEHLSDFTAKPVATNSSPSGNKDIRDMFRKMNDKTPSSSLHDSTNAGSSSSVVSWGRGRALDSSSTASSGNAPITRHLPGIGVLQNERPTSNISANKDCYVEESVGKDPASIRTDRNLSEKVPESGGLQRKSDNELSRKELKRKRFLELLESSSDEEDLTLPGGAKRPEKISKISSHSSSNLRDSASTFSKKGFKSVSSNIKSAEKAKPSVNESAGHSSKSNTSRNSSVSTAGKEQVSGQSKPQALPGTVRMVSCPVCHSKMPDSTINAHLDQCLS